MMTMEKTFQCPSRNTTYNIYPLGDLHIGKRNCAEKPLKKLIKTIAEDRYGVWIGGGDIIDAINPMDKRFEFSDLPDWLYDGDANTTREKMKNIVDSQIDHACNLLAQIAPKCIGLIEGNHEHKLSVQQNRDINGRMCRRLGVPNLTDEAGIRLKFHRHNSTTVTQNLYICHGHGGGRTAGAEPNKLAAMLSEWEDFQICLRGHSHSFCVLAPKPVLILPPGVQVPCDLVQTYRHAANWGAFLYSHPLGPSSYDSRACYPARPVAYLKVCITAHKAVYNKRHETICPTIKIDQQVI